MLAFGVVASALRSVRLENKGKHTDPQKEPKLGSEGCLLKKNLLFSKNKLFLHTLKKTFFPKKKLFRLNLVVDLAKGGL